MLDEAVSILNQAVAQARRRGDIPNVAFTLMWRGKHQTQRGDLRAAVVDLREALDLSVAHGVRVSWPYNVGFLAHALLEPGEADEVLESSEARLEHARALVDLGAALRRANQRTQARERLREGVDLARRLGAFGLAERAYDEIAATGARPRKVLQTGSTHSPPASGALPSSLPTG